ncbi:MAG: hypothetical protein KIT19_14185 [Phycisphaeraceae bacterium]|nr:hypothetical protein [Phycisphaeraceae bacterium]QYK49015.1 MAG: hypothetical protein KF838_03995 [Phycisphaeraceae bacterium]
MRTSISRIFCIAWASCAVTHSAAAQCAIPPGDCGCTGVIRRAAGGLDSIVEVRSGIGSGGIAVARGIQYDSQGWYVGCVKAVVDGACTSDIDGFIRLRVPWSVLLDSPASSYADDNMIQIGTGGFYEPVASYDSNEVLDFSQTPMSSYMQANAFLAGYQVSSGPSRFGSTASSHFKRVSRVAIERTASNVPYDDLITVAIDLVSTDLVKGDNSFHDDCLVSDVGTGTLRVYWKSTVRSMESGTSVYITNSIKQGQAVVTTDGTVLSRQGWFAHPQTSIASYGGDCGGSSQVVTEASSSSYVVSIDGEPSSVEVTQEIRYIPSMLDTRLRMSLNCIAPGDINDSGDVRPVDYDLLVSLLGVDIEDDENGEYHPLADIDGNGLIDEDDVDAFLSMYCLGDFNDDGVLDILDLLDFLDAYGSEDELADMNEDGEIDILDFLLFADWYGIGC